MILHDMVPFVMFQRGYIIISMIKSMVSNVYSKISIVSTKTNNSISVSNVPLNTGILSDLIYNASHRSPYDRTLAQ